MINTFENEASHCMFIGNRHLDEVIAQDTRELIAVDGSFEAIADRMQAFVNFARGFAGGRGYILEHQEQGSLLGGIQEEFARKYGEKFAYENKTAWKLYGERWAAALAAHPKTHFDDNAAVIQIVTTRGFQMCPFSNCRTNTWNEDIDVVSRKNGKWLKVNSGTAHLARVHHLLEKDNDYGISAAEFYKGFM